MASSSTFSDGNGYRVQAYFENIGGLKVRAPVRSAGVVVGRVDSIRFDNESFEAQVTLNLDKHYAFPKDSSAKVLTSGLLGVAAGWIVGGLWAAACSLWAKRLQSHHTIERAEATG